MDFDIGGKNFVVEFLGLGLDTLENILRLLAAQHEDDAFDGIVIFLIAEFAEPGSVTNHHVADIAHANGDTFVRADDDISNIVSVPNQADAPDVIELAALRIESATSVGVVCRQGRRDLGDRQVVAINASGVEQDLVLHHSSAEAGVVCHAVNGAIGALKNPVFDSLQLLGTAIRTLENVAIHKAAGAEQWREAGGYTGGNGCLREPLEDDMAGEIIVSAFLEGENDVGQAVERNGTHHAHARHAVHFQFERKCDEPFDFFGGVIRPLTDDFDLGRREIRVSIDRHALKGKDATDSNKQGEHQHQESLPQGRLYDSMDHSGAVKGDVRRFQRCSELANCTNKLPSPMIWSPGFTPPVTSVCPFRLSPMVTERLPN